MIYSICSLKVGGIIKQFLLLIIFELVSLIIYSIIINFYISVTSFPIFYGSILIAIVIPFIFTFFYKKVFINKLTYFIFHLLTMFVIIFFAIFGPVFVDRSLSYHLLFYVAENEKFDSTIFSTSIEKEVFIKRLEDANISGLITQNSDSTYSITSNGRLLASFLFFIGQSTNSLGEYEQFKQSIENQSVH